MRRLALTILMSSPLLAAAPACAQTYDPSYPVCLHAYTRHGDYYDCRFATIPQCQASASGRSAQCLTNPYYGYTLGRPANAGRRPARVQG